MVFLLAELLFGEVEYYGVQNQLGLQMCFVVPADCTIYLTVSALIILCRYCPHVFLDLHHSVVVYATMVQST